MKKAVWILVAALLTPAVLVGSAQAQTACSRLAWKDCSATAFTPANVNPNTGQRTVSAKVAQKLESEAVVAAINQEVKEGLYKLVVEYKDKFYAAALKNIAASFEKLSSGQLYECGFELSVKEVRQNLLRVGRADDKAARKVLGLLEQGRYQYNHDRYLIIKSSEWIPWSSKDGECALTVHWQPNVLHSAG